MNKLWVWRKRAQYTGQYLASNSDPRHWHEVTQDTKRSYHRGDVPPRYPVPATKSDVLYARWYTRDYLQQWALMLIGR